MSRKRSAPKIEVSGLFGDKPRSELVEEAKERILAKIQKARDEAEARRQKAMVKKAKKDADKTEGCREEVGKPKEVREMEGRRRETG